MNTQQIEIQAALHIGGPLLRTGGAGGRRYELTHLPGSPSVPSVTNLVDSVMRNYGLERWRSDWIERGLKANIGTELTDETVLAVMAASGKEAAESAALGLRVHGLIEKSLRGKLPNWPDDLEPALRAFTRWREAHAEWFHMESEVGVWTAEFAGTVDALFCSADGNEILVVDWKTGGIYDSACMQLGAYCHALSTMLANSNNTTVNPGTKIHGQIVRICAEYPQVNGQRDRTQAKRFNGQIEYVWVDPAQWYPVFDAARRLSVGKKIKIRKETL